MTAAPDQGAPNVSPKFQPNAGALPDAALVRRLAAVLYETLLLAAMAFIVGFLLLPLVSPVAAGAMSRLALPSAPNRALIACALVIVAGAYLIHGWTGGRRTLAQKTWQLRLVTRAGTAVEGKRALTRYAFAFLGPLLGLVGYLTLSRIGLGAYAIWLVGFNFLWALIDRERLFLHDRIAGTRLVVDGGR